MLNPSTSSAWQRRRNERKWLNVREIPTLFHLPKTGGTTMLILHNNARVPSTPEKEESNGLVFFGMPDTPFAIWDAVMHKGSDLRFLGGHMGLADVQMVQQHAPNIQFKPFTILREPNERLASFWAYLQQLNSDNRTLPQMLTTMLPNSMYRMLAPLDSNLTDTITTMSAIKKSLRENFSVVGLTERFDETLMLLTRKGIIRDPSYSKHKVLASSRPKVEDFPENLQKRLRRHNSLDTELYNWAKEYFEEQIRTVPDMQKRVIAFQEEQKQRLEHSGKEEDCEDDLPRFGGWSCQKEKRSERPNRQKQRAETVAKMSVTEQLLYHLQQLNKPRYW